MKVLAVTSKFACLICFVLISIQLRSQDENKTIDLTQASEPISLPLSLKYYQPTQEQKQDLSTLTIMKPINHWGFVCKWEHKNDQKLDWPVRLRLGTLDYVNKLEGK